MKATAEAITITTARSVMTCNSKLILTVDYSDLAVISLVPKIKTSNNQPKSLF